VALARALVAEPGVILFDEPLSNLDAKLREETRKELKSFLSELQITAIYVTHDRVEALALSDTIAVMKSGRIIEIGDPKKIYFQAESRFVADFIGRANLVDVKVKEQKQAETVVECPLGTLVCKKAELPANAEITLCLRPEFIHPLKGAADGKTGNIIQGRIETLVFIGDAYEAEIRCNGILLLARLDPETELAIGEQVCFEVSPAQCLLVAK
jgi:iron(III) transport system ATP-binding protein